MPGTSASCPPSPERRAPARGFTLLELLVVLVLLALATGIVVPSVVRGIEGRRERAVLADVRVLLESLPVLAFRDGHALTMDSAALNARLVERATLPEGWRLQAEPALQYGPTGLATGGAVRLLVQGRPTARWQVQPVSGMVVAETAAGEASR
jgi:general secretion pathway protein G